MWQSQIVRDYLWLDECVKDMHEADRAPIRICLLLATS